MTTAKNTEMHVVSKVEKKEVVHVYDVTFLGIQYMLVNRIPGGVELYYQNGEEADIKEYADVIAFWEANHNA